MVAAPVASPVTEYALAVTRGEVVTGRLVRLACERHLRDLAEGAARGLWFDEAAAERVFRFFETLLCLAEGAHAGRPFILESWQKFIVGSLFGWKVDDGTRRFRTAYVEIGKGNGKSPMAAGIGLFGLIADDEPGAEVYSAATTREQAGILFRDAENMVTASPSLARVIDQKVSNLAVMSTASFFRPVSSEHRGLDGKRVHMALIDEVHEHPSAIVVDKMRAGTKGRRQALIFEITNSGYDRHSVCYQHHDYSSKVLEGVIEDDAWFGYVCGLDEGDEWTDEAVWPKANPNLGVSISYRYLREQVREALGMPSKANIVKRLNFCIWTESSTRWLDLAAWDQGAAAVDPEALTGRTCYGGLDLSSTTDLTGLVLVFPDGAGGYDVLAYPFVPEESLAKRAERDRVPYPVWRDQGHLIATDGNVVDYDVVESLVMELAERYDLRELAIDRWNSTGTQTRLTAAGITVVPFGQGFASMTAPAKELERLVLENGIRHGGHPVLRWCVGNTVVQQDPAGNIKPAKDKSTERIDLTVALTMALGRAMVHSPVGSVYEDRGMRFL